MGHAEEAYKSGKLVNLAAIKKNNVWNLFALTAAFWMVLENLLCLIFHQKKALDYTVVNFPKTQTLQQLE